MIYIVDDDDAVRDALGLLFEAEGWGSKAYTSAQGLLNELPLLTPACIVTDVHMAGVNGLQLLRRLKSLGAEVPVVVITGRADRALAAQALAAGAAAFVEKPFHADEIVAAVRRAMAGGAQASD